jgi:hypothetical protein
MAKLGNKSFQIAYVAILSFSISLYFFRSNLKIQLGPIDDHEIVRFLGSDKRLWIWQIPSVLLEKTEVGSYGESSRFRPTYYLLRLLETSAFGVDATNWYFARIFMVTLTCFFLTLGLIKLITLKNSFVDLLLGASFILSVCSLTAWQDIIARLGPSEIYLALGFSIFFHLSTVLALDTFSKKSWLLLCATYVLTLGAKENGIFLSLPFLILGIYVFLMSSKKSFIIISFVLSNLIGVLISAGWLLGMRSAGGDVYGNSRTFETAQYQILQSLVYLRHSKEFGFAVSAVLIYFIVAKVLRKRLHRSFWYILILEGNLHVLIISEKIFYNSDFGNLRYAIITQISSLLLLAVSIILVLNTLLLINSSRYFFNAGVVIVFGLLLLREIIPTAQQIKANFELVTENARVGTEGWQNLLTDIRDDLLKTKVDAIVIQINNVWDFEPAYAFSQYLEFYGDGLPKYLNVTSFSVGPGLETELLRQLNDYAKYGNSTWMIEPNNSLAIEKVNYCVAWSKGPKDTTICDNWDVKMNGNLS